MLINGWLEDGVFLGAIAEIKQHHRGFFWESQLWGRVGHRRSPYRVLILFGLSSRTTDRLLVKTCHRFFRLFPDLTALLEGYALRRPEVEAIVRRGQIRFVESTVQTLGQGGGMVPRDREGLLQIKGVGEKIAECVVGYGWGQPALPMDGHACRVAERITGACAAGKTGNVAQMRHGLKTMYSNHRPWMKRHSIEMVDIHELLRLHGQVVCGKRPNCARCHVSRCRSRQHEYSGPADPGLIKTPWETPGEPTRETLWQDWRDLLLEPGAPAATPGPGTLSRPPSNEGPAA